MGADCSELQFQWGKKRGIGKKDTQFYESFTFDDEEYSLYDCVYLFKKDEEEPYIGKITKIWEQDKSKKVKILWFFRPSDITNYLGERVPMENEIFLASGEGVGLFNINALEAIAGKCSVVCTSKDSRNRQPSKEAIYSADYIFYCTFDVGTCTISDEIPDKIAGVEVKFLLNREENIPATVSKIEENGLDGNRNIDPGKHEAQADVHMPAPISRIEENGMNDKRNIESRKSKPDADIDDDKPPKKMKLSSDSVKSSDDLEKTKNVISMRTPLIKSNEDDAGKGSVQSIKVPSGEMKVNDKNTKSLDESQLKASAISVKKNETSETHALDVTRRPETASALSFLVSDRSKWFKGVPWEGRMKKANELGTLVFLYNLDLTFTSSDIEDIVYQVFDQSCTAKVIPHLPILSPPYGQAYVIFKTPDAADEAVRKINKGCLMQPNGRPLLASKGMLMTAAKPSTIHGHLSLERRNHMQREEMKKAASTSHCSQPNTIEYEMAMEWALLQEKFKKAHSWLYKRQVDEIKQIKNSMNAKT